MTGISVSMKDAAVMLGLDERTIRKLIDLDIIDARYHGRKRLVSVDSLRAYFDSLPKERATQ